MQLGNQLQGHRSLTFSGQRSNLHQRPFQPARQVRQVLIWLNIETGALADGNYPC